MVDKKNAVNNFDVLKIMSNRNMDIGLCTTFLGGQTVKAGAEVKFGMPAEMFQKLVLDKKYRAVVLMWDTEQFSSVEQELAKDILPNRHRAPTDRTTIKQHIFDDDELERLKTLPSGGMLVMFQRIDPQPKIYHDGALLWTGPIPDNAEYTGFPGHDPAGCFAQNGKVFDYCYSPFGQPDDMLYSNYPGSLRIVDLQVATRIPDEVDQRPEGMYWELRLEKGL